MSEAKQSTVQAITNLDLILQKCITICIN